MTFTCNLSEKQKIKHGCITHDMYSYTPVYGENAYTYLTIHYNTYYMEYSCIFLKKVDI